MDMNTADRQVIAMVNAPHERRAREMALRQKKLLAEKKRTAELNTFWRLVIRMELYTLAGSLMILALSYGWVDGGLGLTWLFCCIIGGFLDLLRYVRGRWNE